jgi:murein DD-endopeptidase MepM/ murein hydrolase activator NlpD
MRNPYSNCTIVSPFGERQRHKGGISQFHRGLDCECPGNTIPAGISGVVTDSGEGRVEGRYLQVTGRVGGVIFYARYLHVDKIMVNKDARVTPTDMVATTGKTGKADKVHLHFELFTYDLMSDFTGQVIDGGVPHYSKGRKLYFDPLLFLAWCDNNGLEY